MHVISSFHNFIKFIVMLVACSCALFSTRTDSNGSSYCMDMQTAHAAICQMYCTSVQYCSMLTLDGVEIEVDP